MRRGQHHPRRRDSGAGKGGLSGAVGQAARPAVHRAELRPQRRDRLARWGSALGGRAPEFQALGLPRVIILMLGTNDTKPQNWKGREAFETEYRSLVATLRAVKSRPKILGLFPAAGVQRTRGGSTPLDEVIDAIERLRPRPGAGDGYQRRPDWPRRASLPRRHPPRRRRRGTDRDHGVPGR
ncbi:MAG: hypothetical protein KIT22_01110 [Verrucomicrobiae bacterium]|nr:hypothetical protein [Verrucomicrobiae bacterium]